MDRSKCLIFARLFGSLLKSVNDHEMIDDELIVTVDGVLNRPCPTAALSSSFAGNLYSEILNCLHRVIYLPHLGANDLICWSAVKQPFIHCYSRNDWRRKTRSIETHMLTHSCSYPLQKFVTTSSNFRFHVSQLRVETKDKVECFNQQRGCVLLSVFISTFCLPCHWE